MNITEEWKIIAAECQNAPVVVKSLIEKLGGRTFDIFYEKASLPRDISGMLEKFDDDDSPDGSSSYVISVNSADPDSRQRFTLAHELGHYMLHRDLIINGVDDDRKYKKTAKFPKTQIGPKQETQANIFAANLLMPRDLVNREWAKPDSTLQSIAKLFQVSEHTMSLRLKSLQKQNAGKKELNNEPQYSTCPEIQLNI